MNPIGALILLATLGVICAAPRRWALMGVMAGTLYLTQGQQVPVLGLNFFPSRFIELAAFCRVMIRREFSFARLNRIDRALLVLYLYSTAIFLLRSPDGQANQIGVAVDAILCYFSLRGLGGDMDDCRWLLRSFLLLLAPYALLLLIENRTGHNFFSFMGGVGYEDWVRAGRLRCTGSFRNPSLLGTLGASFFPLYIGLAMARADRKLAYFGIGLCLFIIWVSNSGGPANCAAVAVVGWMLWPMRTRMKLVRRAIVACLALLAMVMKAPIWYLPAKISDITGGDGWHRSYLMDVAFRNIDKWWLVGMPLRDTKDWFTYNLAVTGGADITNQFLQFGITAGVVSTLIFIWMLTLAFSDLGKALAAVRSSGDGSRENEYFLWGLGVMLAVHLFNWLGIPYFDQTYVLWFMQLAMIANLSQNLLRPPAIHGQDEASGADEVAGGEFTKSGDRPAGLCLG